MSDTPELAPLGDTETPDGIYNASNRSSVKAREKTLKLREDGKLAALREMMRSPYGRAMVYDLLLGAGFWSSGVSATYNSNEMWARAGARQVAVELNGLAWRADSTLYKMMIDENSTAIVGP